MVPGNFYLNLYLVSKLEWLVIMSYFSVTAASVIICVYVWFRFRLPGFILYFLSKLGKVLFLIRKTNVLVLFFIFFPFYWDYFCELLKDICQFLYHGPCHQIAQKKVFKILAQYSIMRIGLIRNFGVSLLFLFTLMTQFTFMTFFFSYDLFSFIFYLLSIASFAPYTEGKLTYILDIIFPLLMNFWCHF